MTAIDDRYKRALIDEYESYVGAKRTADAKQVAKVLREQYGHDVAKQDSDDGDKEEPEQAPERADAEKPPEAAVEPKPRRGRPSKQADDAQSGTQQAK